MSKIGELHRFPWSEERHPCSLAAECTFARIRFGSENDRSSKGDGRISTLSKVAGEGGRNLTHVWLSSPPSLKKTSMHILEASCMRIWLPPLTRSMTNGTLPSLAPAPAADRTDSVFAAAARVLTASRMEGAGGWNGDARGSVNASRAAETISIVAGTTDAGLLLRR